MQLTTPPESKGMGKIGAMSSSRREIIERVRAGLGVERLMVAGPTEGEARRRRCCAGSGGDFVNDAIARRWMCC